VRQVVVKAAGIYLILALFVSCAVFAQEYEELSNFLFETAKKHYEDGRYSDAMGEFKKTLMLAPEHAEALAYIQLIEKQTGLKEEQEYITPAEQEALLDKGRESAISWALGEVEAAQEPEVIIEEFPPVAEIIDTDVPEEVYYEPEGISEIESREIISRELDRVERFLEPLDKIDELVEDINASIDPVRVSGEYSLGLGARDSDLIWKDANGDYNETNWRRINNDFGINTYDTRVYDRLRVNIDKAGEEEGFGFHSNVTIDPWTFIGKTDAVNVTAPTGDRANVQFKYWSGTNSIINETFLTLENGATIAPPETKLVNGKVPAISVDSTWDETFSIPELEIDEEMWPVRELWVEYKSEDKLKLRFFPIAYEDQALTSDDPLQLSGHKIYWEESPWLDRWRPGIVNTGAAPVDFTKGEWEDDLSFFTRDSSMTRLTSLRGFSVVSNPVENISIESTVASPKGLWQDYDAFDNVEGATRIKITPNEDLQIGFINTTRYGLIEGEKDAENIVAGGDVAYKVTSDIEMKAEVAYSYNEQDLTQDPYNTKDVGNVYRFELQKGKVQEERPEKWDEDAYEKAEPLDYSLRLMYTHMDKGFYPALANYRITRKDPFWGRHIHFEEPYKEYYGGLYYPTLNWYDIRSYRIGDSVDVDRDVVSLRLENAFYDNALETLFDVRNAHEASSGKYIETIGRAECDWQATDKLSVKFLGIYHDLPRTKGGIDPILYDVDTNNFFNNAYIEDGKDPSLKTASCGFEYDFFDWFSFDFVYEFTNDFTVGLDDYPRGLLNDTSFSTTTEDGLVWRESAPFLYSQQFFPRPPYPWFNIYKAGFGIRPFDELRLRVEATKNDYKYASQVDDNMNHLGFEADYDVTEKLSLKLNYTYSKSYDLFLQTQGELEYRDHHNVFVNLDYKMEEKGVFSLQFGEAALLPYSTMFTTSPYPGFLPTVDTAHIVRAYFSRRF